VQLSNTHTPALITSCTIVVTTPTCFAHSLRPSLGNYKLHRHIQINVWSWKKNIIVHAQTFTSNSLRSVYYSSLEAFAATVLNEMFSRRQQLQYVKFYQSFLDCVPILALPSHRHTLKMGTESVPQRSVNLHILTQLPAWDYFIENLLFTASTCFGHRI
jgi:hypothetical protein